MLTIDLVNDPVNIITRAVRESMMELFDRIDRDETIKGAVLISGLRSESSPSSRMPRTQRG